jgi:hypothetical protein
LPGYWDWPLDGRGLLFAPVVFNRPLWNTPGWRYTPSYCVAPSGLLSSLFTGPGGGYYFGNYYGPSYNRVGFRPWFAAGGVSNPLFGWYRWRNLNNPGWVDGLRTTYRGRYNGSLTRPPLTLAQQTTILNRNVNVQNNRFNSLHMVQPLRQYNAARLTRLSAAQLTEQRNRARHLQELSVQRQARREIHRSLPLAHTAAFASAAHGHPAAPQHPPRVSVPRIATPHPQPPARPAQVRHAAPAHHPAPARHVAPAPVHRAAPAHHPAPAGHRSAPPKHGGAGHGGHGQGGGHGGGHHRR